MPRRSNSPIQSSGIGPSSNPVSSSTSAPSPAMVSARTPDHIVAP